MDPEHQSLTISPSARTSEGDDVAPFVLRAPGEFIIGRSSAVDWAIPDQSVSRRHASVSVSDGVYALTDLGSRHGTTVNGARLKPHTPHPIGPGDLLGFGGWACRCHSGSREAGKTTPFASVGVDRGSVSVIDTSRLSGVAQRGLEALLSLTRALNEASDDKQVAEAVVEAVQTATGCHRVVVTRPVSSEGFELLASGASEPVEISRSLLEEAARLGLVELRVARRDENQANSIMELSIRSAICAAIMTGDTPAAILTIDTRDSERTLPSDAAAFCQSVAHLAGLAFERRIAAELARRHEQLAEDLGAARRAQEFLSPQPGATIGAISYVFQSIPGRVVAGDLFDIFALDATRTAFFLGDVSGKGVGAAVLMAAAQSQLRTHLLSGRRLAEAVVEVNADLYRRTDPSKFITLIAGVIDAGAGTLEIVDAGHGFCAVVDPGRTPFRLQAGNGLPLGIVEDAEYEAHVRAFGDGATVVVYSDGAVEQTNPAGEQFGLDAVIRSIESGASPASITGALIADVRAHAQDELADDLTVAALRLARTE